MSLPQRIEKPVPAPLRVMVVDDSLVMRGLITRMINKPNTGAEVVATAGNGKLAVDRAQQKDLDVVILDVEMPLMDGLTALPMLLAADPRLVIIMASSLTTRNADISLKALAAGAKDYVPKPSAVTPGAGATDFERELIDKIQALGARFRRAPATVAGNSAADPIKAPVKLRTAAATRIEALAIGCSTGGPTALVQVLKELRAPLRVPLFITQHMPPTFTALLAENLTRETGHRCAEAVHNESVVPGRVYLAPGDHHMTLCRKNGALTIQLDQREKENFCRPAVDPMLRSLCQFYDRRLLTLILTGMGQDGLLGCEAAVKAGGAVIAQDESSSVVWGMPGAVAKASLCSAVLPLAQIAREVSVLLEK